MVSGCNRSRALAALTSPAALILLLLLLAVPAFAGTVKLAWDPVVNPALTGYTVHYGPTAGNYTTSIDVSNTTSYTVTNLTEGAAYHFAVTAYDAARTPSPYSNDILATVSYASPVADFSASTLSGPAPLAMNFINSSTGTITTYAWTFGDGGTSNAANPSHVFSTAGVYTIALTVTGPGGSSTKTRANYITVTGLLDATAPTAPSSLTATASGTGTINLAWTASTDNVGVTGYRIERCQGATCSNYAQIATASGTTYGNTGLSAATTYRYRVRANDAAGNLGGYSPIATATTAAAPDTTAPTAPSSLTATASGTGTINLAWTASTDNVGVTGYRIERCQGATCSNYAQIATASGTTYGNTGLSAATTYRYRVRANDAAGNLGGYSPIATATTAAAPDTTAPTAPSSLTATASGTGTINLAWTASTDNVGVTGYRIERCQGATCSNYAQIATASGTTYGNTGLSAATTYRYRVRANDAAGNLGGYSPIATATTAAAPDTTAPTAPSSLTATASGTGTINLAWTASTDNVGVTGYRIERCQGATCSNYAQIATASGTTYGNTGLSAATTYRYRVRANDAAGNLGGYSPIATATTAAAPDTTAPTAPSSLTATASGTGTINLAWTASTDNVGVTGYRIERCQGATCSNYAQIATASGTTYGNTGLSAATTYRYRVRANDAAGNLGGYSPIATATTAAAPDTTAPTAPSSLTATASGTGTINLAWTASTDNVGVTGYRIERCQGATCSNYAQIATASGTTYGNTGLSAATTYRYRVRANDAAGNLGGYSPIATATTAAAPDTTAPTAPSSLTATASGTGTINLAWTASTDNVGVTGYRIERCQGATCSNYAQIATASGTTYGNTGLSAATTYRYRVRANDAAGNLGGYSPIATATTAAAPDTTAPTAPSSLTTLLSESGTSVVLVWTASTDNVGVADYRIERCQGSGCTTFAQVGTSSGATYPDGGLVAGTTYRYRVRAADAAGNLSGYSNIASVTTTSASSPAAPITFVQVKYATPQTPQANVSVQLTQAQTTGNLNVVVVGWNDSSASVTSVTDSKGNVYARAVGPTILPGMLSQSIYYAKNIVAASAGANTVTVQFSMPAVYADIRVVEYSGLDKVNPVDVTAAGVGTGTLSSTASVTTSNANNLLFGANTVTSWTLGAGTGYTTRTITSPDGDIAEDRVVTSVGTYSATAPLTGGSWVMQLVAFKAAP